MLFFRPNFFRRSIFSSPQVPFKRWHPDVGKIKFCTRMIHRALLAKLFTLRESAGALFRRFGGIYRAGCFGFHQDFAASRGQRILLATCLISFVQDSISEDEMMITVETFDVTKYNELSKFAQKSQQKEERNSPQVAQQPIERAYSSLESPLTFYVRDLRQLLRERQHEFFRNLFNPQKDEPVPSSDGAETPLAPASSPRGVMLMDLSSRLSADGTGFVDSAWECMINRPDLRMWRRPSCKTSNNSSKTAIGLYEYRVCGSFSDISARCFLEVQLNLAYRRHWDKSVVVLESRKSANAAESEVIRWVARFPFPLARREYIYTRRWWLTTAGIGDQAFALIVSRVGNTRSRDSTASTAMVPQDNSEEAQSGGGLVPVRSYESNMLIRSHGSIDEPGLDYFLIYFDDPQLVCSTEAASRLSLTVIPRLLDKLHDAALNISTKGLPDTVPPVVLPSRQLIQSEDATSVTSKPSITRNPFPSETTSTPVDNTSCGITTNTTTTPLTPESAEFFFHS
ncbi:star lipid transfer protein 7 [Echinococcus multilocularis]|uniref:Star lipid transfer protein 7 n=1 Tax=Echinococcus multilocularis TaxID=6211 RepID=A0A068YG90_ECHMU|nr:star lipid transfer protein 7 [Echinococcus multilocularis]